MTPYAVTLLAAAALLFPGPAAAARLRAFGAVPRSASPMAAARAIDSPALVIGCATVAAAAAVAAGVGIGIVAGTAIVGGVNPRKAGTTVDFDGTGVPVFGTVASRFNDDGVTALYQELAARLVDHYLHTR